MNGVLDHDSNEMNLVMKHAPGAGSIGGPVDQQSSTELRMLPLSITYNNATTTTNCDAHNNESLVVVTM